jgi:tripartite-type tricarboxylate transporter receptor subunit TctC
LSAALFVKRAELDMTHISYKGGAPAVTDLLGGNVQMYFGNFSELYPHVSGGNIRIIGVSSDKRAAQLLQVATIAESGFPGFKTVTWNGLMAPAKISPDIFNKLALSAREAANDPAVKKTLTELGITPVGGTPEEFTKRIASEGGLLLEAIKAANTGNP